MTKQCTSCGGFCGKVCQRENVAQLEQVSVALKQRLIKIHDALCNELGDTDPCIDDDMTDEEICEEMPVFWAAKEIADLIGDAPWTDHTHPQTKKPEQGPVMTFDEVWDSIDWDEWRIKSIRDVVKMIHSKTHPQHKQRYILWPVKGVRVDGDKVIIMAKGGNDAARWLCGEILFMAKDIKAQP
jgi:hypothetical protein